ncbi:FecR family protein [Pedobacter roseus]|uniref:FecR family protein n=1 Tax=Pedobacter roseus TaxID=336820 RepID=A0A7G9QK46_9SPHI|nr:FecR family protein [Pedobacter roseus]QNN43721.1 FecR family protein [Pedobacter roseus]
MSKLNVRQFIRDYLDGKLSAKQSARLETWYLLKAEESSTPEPQIDYVGLEAKIWSKILDEVSEPLPDVLKVKKLNNTYRKLITIGIAASILLISGVGYLLFRSKTNDQFVVAKQYDLPAGTNKAMLTLSDGSVIDLNKDIVGKVATEAGLEITKAKDGTLVYTTTDAKPKSAGFNTISTPAGGQYAVILPDGSKVWLNAGSSLKYPTTFAKNERSVILTGEGYFEVAHVDGIKGRVPFSVSVVKGNSQMQKLEVLGTHFNINAYADEPYVKSTLLEGSVKIVLNDGKTRLLKPGQQAKLNNQNIDIQSADTDMEVAWKKGEFVFREDLRSAMRKVARWYNVEVVYDDTAPGNLILGGWMSRSTNISEVLNHIQLTGKVHFKLEGRRVIVSK